MIVALDEQLRPAELARQPGQLFNRRRELREREAGQFFNVPGGKGKFQRLANGSTSDNDRTSATNLASNGEALSFRQTRAKGNGKVRSVRANKETPALLPDYEPSVGAVTKALASYWGNEVSDPAKVAQLILRLAASDHLPAHLLIGSDAVEFAGQAEATREAEAERWRQLSVSTDFNAAGPLPAVRF